MKSAGWNVGVSMLYSIYRQYRVSGISPSKYNADLILNRVFAYIQNCNIHIHYIHTQF